MLVMKPIVFLECFFIVNKILKIKTKKENEDP